VTLGAYMANGIEQKGIDSLQQCIKKCASAGLGIPPTVCIRLTENNDKISEDKQHCINAVYLV